MPIKLLPDGTPEERARSAKSAALADQLDKFILAQKVTEGTAIDAIGMLFGVLKSDTVEKAGQYATAISVAIAVHFKLKEKANVHGQ